MPCSRATSTCSQAKRRSPSARPSRSATWLGSTLALRRETLASITERELNATLRFACTAASVTCSRRGADLPTRDEIDLALAATDDS